MILFGLFVTNSNVMIHLGKQLSSQKNTTHPIARIDPRIY